MSASSSSSVEAITCQLRELAVGLPWWEQAPPPQQQQRQRQRSGRSPWWQPSERLQELQRLEMAVECATLVEDEQDGSVAPPVAHIVALITQPDRVPPCSHAELMACTAMLCRLIAANHDEVSRPNSRATLRRLARWSCDKLDSLFDANTERAATLEYQVLVLLSTLADFQAGRKAMLASSSGPFVLARLCWHDSLSGKALKVVCALSYEADGVAWRARPSPMPLQLTGVPGPGWDQQIEGAGSSAGEQPRLFCVALDDLLCAPKDALGPSQRRAAVCGLYVLWRLSSSGGSSAERAARRREVARGLLEYRLVEVLAALPLLAADAAADTTSRKAADRMLRVCTDTSTAQLVASAAGRPSATSTSTSSKPESARGEAAKPPELVLSHRPDLAAGSTAATTPADHASGPGSPRLRL